MKQANKTPQSDSIEIVNALKTLMSEGKAFQITITVPDGGGKTNDNRRIGRRKADYTPQSVKSYVSDILLGFGIPASIKGYQYMREAIVQLIEKPEMLDSITKVLYPSVAGKFNSNPKSVERGIRHAITTAWLKGNTEALDAYFGVCGKKQTPTNSEFLALIADKLRLRLAEQV